MLLEAVDNVFIPDMLYAILFVFNYYSISVLETQ